MHIYMRMYTYIHIYLKCNFRSFQPSFFKVISHPLITPEFHISAILIHRHKFCNSANTCHKTLINL